MPLPLGDMLVTVSCAMPHGTCSSEAGVSNRWPSSCCQTTSPIMPLPLGDMLVTVNTAMPHGTCSLTTAGGPPVTPVT
ncbi:unnamed protein product [Staurois parvus]|uniref:Uncharacterized protein n=1 Tax=Staurois parvus TaxID=386267 RepID=A0ABN9CL40_9NEOB|nr:unnamed protein product [Staurois parvus]